jgi:EthD domain
MLKVFSFLSKRDDIDTQAFIDYYENNHVPLVLSVADTPTGYKRNYLVRGDEFNREDDAIGTDEEKFLNRSRTRAYVIEEHVTAG